MSDIKSIIIKSVLPAPNVAPVIFKVAVVALLYTLPLEIVVQLAPASVLTCHV